MTPRLEFGPGGKRGGALVLAGPEGRYITGQTIHVNGGLFFGK